MPYGLEKTNNGSWVAFNRNYSPIGIKEKNITSKGLNGDEKITLGTLFGDISEKVLQKIASRSEDVSRNEKGEIVKVWLYFDSSDPINTNLESDWQKYFEKLRILSTFQQ